MTRYSLCTLMVFGAVLVCGQLMAADMSFKGTLIEPPPCNINNEQDVLVNFGDSVGVNKVDGVNYIQPVEYHLTCDVTSPRDGLTIVMTTTDPASYDASALNTTSPGLGIRILVDGEPVSFGKNIPVDITKVPVMQAVPVKDPGISLSEGAFTASATLQVVYQ